MRSLTISTDRIGPRRWCLVRVHDALDQLRDAAHRLRPERGREGWDDCYGCFHPTWHWTNSDTGQREYSPNGYAGLIRLAEGHVNTEIVSHELVHAAAQIYRMNVHPYIRLGKQCADREESFAYIYGELFCDLITKLDF